MSYFSPHYQSSNLLQRMSSTSTVVGVGFEQTLSEEDKEQDGDRWCSWQAQGQSFWQILNQWVWNWRIRAGAVQSPQLCGRQTEWSSALPEMIEECATSQPEAPQPASVPQSSHPTPRYGAMTVSEGWAKSRHKYAGNDFKIMDDESVECPAGHRMYRREIRYTRRGDMQMLFSMNPHLLLRWEESRPYGIKPPAHGELEGHGRCLSNPSTGVRRVSVQELETRVTRLLTIPNTNTVARAIANCSKRSSN